MRRNAKTLRSVHTAIVAATMSLPAAVLADEAPVVPVLETGDYHSGLEDLSLRRNIADLSRGHVLQPDLSGGIGDGLAADPPDIDFEGGSGGGYVSFGSPATSTFLDSVAVEPDERLLDGVEFGVDWRTDVSGMENQDYCRLGRCFSGSDIGRVGVRADLTAMLRDERDDDRSATAWRVTGMLGSTSLSLLSEFDNLPSYGGGDGAGLLWDIGVGWSSGAMSVSAGYESAYSFDEFGEDGSTVAVLSLGADYAILPGLSIYGEFNVIDGLSDSNEEGPGAVVIVGTGVSF